VSSTLLNCIFMIGNPLLLLLLLLLLNNQPSTVLQHLRAPQTALLFLPVGDPLLLLLLLLAAFVAAAAAAADCWSTVLAALVSSTLLNCIFPFFTYVESSGMLGEFLPQVRTSQQLPL
jgi:hypothetical protein